MSEKPILGKEMCSRCLKVHGEILEQSLQEARREIELRKKEDERLCGIVDEQKREIEEFKKFLGQRGAVIKGMTNTIIANHETISDQQRLIEKLVGALEAIFDEKRHGACYEAEDVKYMFASRYHNFRKIAEKALSEARKGEII